ncbi:MAG TPA: hypothetical protein VMU50_12170 [Polyangia bacterium]|nr:hypothetical protein [Polyangia bacterium]
MRGAAATVLAAALVGASPGAQARATSIVPYPAADVWPTAIRFLRVDRDYAIKEKDETAGYVIFDVVENKKTYRGTLELVAATDREGRAGTQLVVTLGELPRHYETALLDKLSVKLRDERGPPPPTSLPKRPAPAPVPPGGNPDAPPARPPTTDPSGVPRPPVWGPEVR